MKIDSLPKNLQQLLVVDIETASQYESFLELPDQFKKLWETKYSYSDQSETIEDFYFKKAGIFAEFGRIIVIGIGFFYINEQNELSLRVKSMVGNEFQLLSDFKELVDNKFGKKPVHFCAHNGKEFDYPFLCRRFMANGIPLPKSLDISGKKPWEVPHIDTMELWKFGDKKNYTSLELLAAVFNLPSSKSDIHGSDVNRVFYKEQDPERIARYCAEDVALTAKIYLKMNYIGDLKDSNIEFITS